MSILLLLIIVGCLLFGAAAVRSALGTIITGIIFLLCIAMLVASCQPNDPYMIETSQ